jgi:NitT/TauT family transport system substrate-binding protein
VSGSFAGRACAFLAALLIVSAGMPSAEPAKPPITIHVISSPSDDLRPFLYAQSAGLFKAAGLDVVLEHSSSGAAVAQAVIGGAMDVGKATLSSFIAAYARGLPFVLIAPSAEYRKDHATSAIVVTPNSPLKSVLELQGKVVACTAIGDIGYLGLRALIDEAGGDSSTVKWIELPTSAVPAAVEQGRVDAGLTTEPSLSQELRGGRVRILVDMLAGYHRPIIEGAYFSTRDYVSKNREAVTKFAAVLQRAARYTNAHEAETIPLYVAASGIEPQVAAEMHHSYTAESFEPGLIQPIIDLDAKYKLIPQRFDARDLMSSSVK